MWTSLRSSLNVDPLVLVLGAILKVFDLQMHRPCCNNSTQVPAYVGAPLKRAPEGKWPLIIFSHGLAGTKMTYRYIL